MADWITGNRYLNQAEMEHNALIIRDYLIGTHGWSINAVSAVLGNMQHESSINPGIWENLSPYVYDGRSSGYGLVQWTPYTKYSEWAGSNWLNNGDKELDRITYEAQQGIQWFYNSQVHMNPPISFSEFIHSELDIDTLSDYWLYFYEHPADPIASREQRRRNTRNWYEFLEGHPYSGIPIYLLWRGRKNHVKR